MSLYFDVYWNLLAPAIPELQRDCQHCGFIVGLCRCSWRSIIRRAACDRFRRASHVRLSRGAEGSPSGYEVARGARDG